MKDKVFRIGVTRRIVRKTTLLVRAESEEKAVELAEAYSEMWLGDDEMTTGSALDKLTRPVLAPPELVRGEDNRTSGP